MGGFPEELVFILIFAVVWLLQFLRQRRQQAPPAPEDVRDADAEVKVEVELPAQARPSPAPRPQTFTPNLTEGPRRALAQHDRAAPASHARQTARRYSRSALMGDRRAVQDAIVVATILQPCRAHRPYGAE
jgi:hypothetical protein